MTEDSLKFFHSVSEKDRRRFAALEADRLGWHGVREVSKFYGIHPHTIRAGKRELTEGFHESPGRVRKPGGGGNGQKVTIPILITRLSKKSTLEILRHLTPDLSLSQLACS